MENLRLFVFHEKIFQLHARHWDRRGIAVACVCPFVRLVRLSRSPSKHVCVITQEIVLNPFWNLAEIFVLEIIWEVRLWVLQVTKYVHNGPKSDFDIFGIPKVVLQVRAFKCWSFTELLDICDESFPWREFILLIKAWQHIIWGGGTHLYFGIGAWDVRSWRVGRGGGKTPLYLARGGEGTQL